jgi:hypothetical protein
MMSFAHPEMLKCKVGAGGVARGSKKRAPRVLLELKEGI